MVRAPLLAGSSTRNIGAVIAPLLIALDADQKAVIMVVLGLPPMVLSALFGLRHGSDSPTGRTCPTRRACDFNNQGDSR